jgi:ribosomal protein L7/L12
VFASKSDLVALDRRLCRIEGLLELIARRLEIAPEEIESVAKQRVSAEVVKLAAEGRKIHAIKLLRDQEGLGLAEAKRAVDDLTERADIHSCRRPC